MRKGVASSSSKAAALLPEGVTGFVGFGSAPAGGAERSVTTALAHDVQDPDLQLVLKRLGKRASTTKIKALAELSALVATRTPDQLAPILPVWVVHYGRLTVDADRRVRAAANVTLADVCKAVGKLLSSVIKTLLPFWLVSLHDPLKEVSSAARAALNTALPVERQQRAVLVCQSELVTHLQSLLTSTPSTMSDSNLYTPEEQLELYQRVTAGALGALAFVTAAVPAGSDGKPVRSLLTQLLERPEFLKLGSNKSATIRQAWYAFLSVLVRHAAELIQPFLPSIAPLVLGAFGDREAAIHADLWESVLVTTRAFPQVFQHADLRRKVWPRLWTMLRNAVYGSCTVSYPLLLPFLSAVPGDLALPEAGPTLWLAEWFAALWTGRTSDFLAPRSAAVELCRAYTESMHFALQHLAPRAPAPEDVASFLLLRVLPTALCDLLGDADFPAPVLCLRVFANSLRVVLPRASPALATAFWSLLTEQLTRALQPAALPTTPSAAKAEQRRASKRKDAAAAPADPAALLLDLSTPVRAVASGDTAMSRAVLFLELLYAPDADCDAPLAPLQAPVSAMAVRLLDVAVVSAQAAPSTTHAATLPGPSAASQAAAKLLADVFAAIPLADLDASHRLTSVLADWLAASRTDVPSDLLPLLQALVKRCGDDATALSSVMAVLLDRVVTAHGCVSALSVVRCVTGLVALERRHACATLDAVAAAVVDAPTEEWCADHAAVIVSVAPALSAPSATLQLLLAKLHCADDDDALPLVARAASAVALACDWADTSSRSLLAEAAEHLLLLPSIVSDADADRLARALASIADTAWVASTAAHLAAAAHAQAVSSWRPGSPANGVARALQHVVTLMTSWSAAECAGIVAPLLDDPMSAHAHTVATLAVAVGVRDMFAVSSQLFASRTPALLAVLSWTAAPALAWHHDVLRPWLRAQPPVYLVSTIAAAVDAAGVDSAADQRALSVLLAAVLQQDGDGDDAAATALAGAVFTDVLHARVARLPHPRLSKRLQLVSEAVLPRVAAADAKPGQCDALDQLLALDSSAPPAVLQSHVERVALLGVSAVPDAVLVRVVPHLAAAGLDGDAMPLLRLLGHVTRRQDVSASSVLPWLHDVCLTALQTACAADLADDAKALIHALRLFAALLRPVPQARWAPFHRDALRLLLWHFADDSVQTMLTDHGMDAIAAMYCDAVDAAPLALLDEFPASELHWYPLLASAHPRIAAAAYRVLSHRIRSVVEVPAAAQEHDDGDGTAVGALPQSPPSGVLADVPPAALTAVMEQLDVAHGGPREHTAFLLLWLLVLRLFDCDDARVRAATEAFVRQNRMLHILLPCVCMLLPQDRDQAADAAALAARAAAVSPTSSLLTLDTSAVILDRDTPLLAAHVLLRVLMALPAPTRQWWNEQDRSTSYDIERFVASYITPVIIAQESSALAALQAELASDVGDSEMSVSIVRAVREVTMTYSYRDDARLEVVLVLPSAFPLKLVDLECRQRVGVPDARWRKWHMAMNQMLFAQNGSIGGVVRVWKQNLDSLFQGVEECPICYAVVSPGDHALPKLACKTCHNKFHSSCLYKWFSTSQKSKCPLCQTAW